MIQEEGPVISTDDEEAKRLRRSGEILRMCAPLKQGVLPNNDPGKRASDSDQRT